ncbi:mechanosensitive ion channel family protein [Neisseriaceae bacterium CLB008]
MIDTTAENTAQFTAWFRDTLFDMGFTITGVNAIFLMSAFLFALLILFISVKLSNKALAIFMARINVKHPHQTSFAQALLKCRTPVYVSAFIPVVLLTILTPFIWLEFPNWSATILYVLDIISIILVVQIIRSLVYALSKHLKAKDNYRDKPLDSYAQVVSIVLYFITVAALYVKFTDKSLVGFFGTLGAASAILMLMFKDTIMGIVASVQVSMNDMVRVGDWITMNSYGADGDVLEINLTTVKVSNFDKTVTTIPTYALISNSFQNWRAMFDAQCRRIKRSVIIRPSSVKYLTPEEVDAMKKIQMIEPYITQRQADIEKYNSGNGIDKELMINGRNLTNLGLFRKYIDTYLNQHSALHKDMSLMVRQLQPTEFGLPLEIYAFSKDPRWANFEYIQADIFDHVIAAAPYFDLVLYELGQSPMTGEQRLTH